MNPNPEDPRNIETMVKSFFKGYYNKPLNKINKNQQGVEYVAYDEGN